MSEKKTRTAVVISAVAVVALVIGGVAGYLFSSGTSKPDVSADGQISYACALAEKVRAGHQTTDDWGPLDQEPAYNELNAIPALLGLDAPQKDADAKEFSSLDWNALHEINDDYLAEVHKTLDATINLCENR